MTVSRPPWPYEMIDKWQAERVLQFAIEIDQIPLPDDVPKYYMENKLCLETEVNASWYRRLVRETWPRMSPLSRTLFYVVAMEHGMQYMSQALSQLGRADWINDGNMARGDLEDEDEPGCDYDEDLADIARNLVEYISPEVAALHEKLHTAYINTILQRPLERETTEEDAARVHHPRSRSRSIDLDKPALPDAGT